MTVQELSSENVKLRNEIKEAAECGLAIVEEKLQLQTQYEELVDLYETSKEELRCAVEVRVVSKWVGVFAGLFNNAFVSEVMHAI